MKQASMEIVLSMVTMLARNLGMQVDVSEISKKENFWRKKYMGVLRWESSRVRRIMIRFPVMLNRYVINRKKKITICHFGSSVNPRSINVVTSVWFLMSKSLLNPSSLEKSNWCELIGFLLQRFEGDMKKREMQLPPCYVSTFTHWLELQAQQALPNPISQLLISDSFQLFLYT